MMVCCVVGVFGSEEGAGEGRERQGSEKKTRRVGVEVLGGRVGLEW